MNRAIATRILVTLVLSGTNVGCDPTAVVDPRSTQAPSAAPTVCDPSGAASPTPFRRGTARIEITTGDRVAVDLDQIGDTTFYAQFDPECPGDAQAEWTTSSGSWLLTVLANTGPDDAFSGQAGTLSIQNFEGEPPVYADGAACTITIATVSAAGLVGHADCPSLRWLSDYAAAEDPMNAEPLPGLAPFAAAITFEARP